MLGEESYLDLLQSAPHWAFELTVELVVGVLIGKFLWGLIKRHIHKDDETLEAKIQKQIDEHFKHMHEDSGIEHEES